MIAYVLLRVFLILLLVAANAFFAAAEFALVSVRETRIQQLIEAGRVGARTVLKLHQQLARVVNGVQLGVTICSLTLGWVGEPVLARVVREGDPRLMLDPLELAREPKRCGEADGTAVAVAESDRCDGGHHGATCRRQVSERRG